MNTVIIIRQTAIKGSILFSFICLIIKMNLYLKLLAELRLEDAPFDISNSLESKHL